jgi:hypothetical protein
MMPLIDRLKKQLGFASATRSPDTEPSSAIPLVPTPAGPFQLRQALGWPASDFTSVSWSPDGQRIAAGSADRCVWIWNVTTGAVEHLLASHRSAVWSVAWSLDGQQLACGSEDRTVRLWEAQSGRELRRLCLINAPLVRQWLSLTPYPYEACGVLMVRRVRPLGGRGAPAGTRTYVGAHACHAAEDRLTGHEGGPWQSALPQECRSTAWLSRAGRPRSPLAMRRGISRGPDHTIRA